MVNKKVCAIVILLERVQDKPAYFSYFLSNELISRGRNIFGARFSNRAKSYNFDI